MLANERFTHHYYINTAESLPRALTTKIVELGYTKVSSLIVIDYMYSVKLADQIGST